MGSLRSDQIVTSVVCRSDNHIARSEGLERSLHYRCWQMWAVAIERDDALLTRRREVREYRGKACSKALTRLRHDAHRITCQARQIVDIRGRAHYRNFNVAHRLRQRHGVVQKTAIKARYSRRRKILPQPGFDRARLRRLGHNDQRAVPTALTNLSLVGGFHR